MSVVKRFLEMYRNGTYHPSKQRKEGKEDVVIKPKQESQPVKNEKENNKQNQLKLF